MKKVIPKFVTDSASGDSIKSALAEMISSPIETAAMRQRRVISENRSSIEMAIRRGYTVAAIAERIGIPERSFKRYLRDVGISVRQTKARYRAK